jgi:hypothetical protein
VEEGKNKQTPNSQKLKKTRLRKLQMKAMMIVFFGIRGAIMIEGVLEDQTINQKYYLEVLSKLRERERKKEPELWKEK